MIRFIFFGCAMFFALAAAQPSPNGGGIAPANVPVINRTTTDQPVQTHDPNEPNGMTFVRGKVVLEDGSPPPESVQLERVCGANRRLETRTDAKGHFSFQVGAGAVSSERMLDVTTSSVSTRPAGELTHEGTGKTQVPNRMDFANLRGCELRAVLPGYQANSVNLSAHSSFENPDVGIIVLKRLGGREGDTISFTNSLAPKSAKKAFDKARQLMAAGNAAGAQKELLKAVELYPKYASAWTELGRLQMEDNDAVVARQSLRTAQEADPKYLPPYEHLATLALRGQNWPDLLAATDRLIKLDSYDYPQAYYYNALANLNLNHPEAAEKSAREALKRDAQRFSRAKYVLGLSLARRGEYSLAAEQFKEYLASRPSQSEQKVLTQHIAEMEKLAGNPASAR